MDNKQKGLDTMEQVTIIYNKQAYSVDLDIADQLRHLSTRLRDLEELGMEDSYSEAYDLASTHGNTLNWITRNCKPISILIDNYDLHRYDQPRNPIEPFEKLKPFPF